MAKISTRIVSVAGKRRLIAHGLGEVGFLGNIKMQKFQGAASVSKAIGRLMCQKLEGFWNSGLTISSPIIATKK
jgi:hypothetical protein